MTPITILVLLAGPLAGMAAAIAAERQHAGRSWLSGPLPGWPVLLGGALAGGGIAALSMLAAPAGTLWMTAGLGWLLLALALIDLRTRILPDGLNLAVLLLGGVMAALTRPDALVHHAAGAVAGFAILWTVETLYLRLRGFDGLGRGDAKLLGALGMWVTWTGLAPILLIASLSGIGAVLLAALVRRESVTPTTAIAFGPWIALAGFLVWLAAPVAAPLLFG